MSYTCIYNLAFLYRALTIKDTFIQGPGRQPRRLSNITEFYLNLFYYFSLLNRDVISIYISVHLHPGYHV